MKPSQQVRQYNYKLMDKRLATELGFPLSYIQLGVTREKAFFILFQLVKMEDNI